MSTTEHESESGSSDYQVREDGSVVYGSETPSDEQREQAEAEAAKTAEERDAETAEAKEQAKADAEAARKATEEALQSGEHEADDQGEAANDGDTTTTREQADGGMAREKGTV